MQDTSTRFRLFVWEEHVLNFHHVILALLTSRDTRYRLITLGRGEARVFSICDRSCAPRALLVVDRLLNTDHQFYDRSVMLSGLFVHPLSQNNGMFIVCYPCAALTHTSHVSCLPR